MNCVNHKHKDVVDMASKANLPALIIASKIAVWQDNNGLDKWPTLDDLDFKYKTKSTLINDLFKESKVITSKDALETIANSNDVLSILAQKLLKFDKTNPVAITLIDEPFITYNIINENGKELEKRALGIYYPDSNDIEITNVQKGQSVLLLHEILHAQTYRFLRNNGSEAKKLYDLYNHAVNNVENYEEVYGLSTIDEFMVAVFTDSSFIKLMQTIPPHPKYKGNTFLDSFVKFILEALNIKSTSPFYLQSYKAVNELLDYSLEYTDTLKDFEEYINGTVIQANNKSNKVINSIGYKELNSSLNQLIDSLDINVKQVKYLINREGKRDNSLTAEAKVIKTAKSVQSFISLVEGKTDATIVAEEVAHVFTGLLGFDNPLYKALETHIVKYPEYSEVLETYPELNEKEAKFEAIGKLLANNMVELSSQNPQKSILLNLWNAIINWARRKVFSPSNREFITIASDLLANNISQYDLQLYNETKNNELEIEEELIYANSRNNSRLDWMDDSNESKRYWANQAKKRENNKQVKLNLGNEGNINKVIDTKTNKKQTVRELNKVRKSVLQDTQLFEQEDKESNSTLVDYLTEDIINNMPQYDYLSDEERRYLAEEIVKGNLTLSCTI